MGNVSVKDYSGRLMDVVNQMGLVGEASFTNHKVFEKIMVLAPDKFEAKISKFEESCDLQTLTIAKLTSKLHAQEQRVSMGSDEDNEGVFPAKHNGRSSNNNKGRVHGSSRKDFFCLVLIAKEPTMLKKIVCTRINLFFTIIFAINVVTVKSIADLRKISLSSNQNNKQN